MAICEKCSKEFEPTRPKQRFCSKKCSHAAWVKENQDRRREHVNKSDRRHSARIKKWKSENADHLKEYRHQHYLKNKAEYVERAKIQQQRDPEAAERRRAKYEKTEKGREAGYNGVARRRARKLAAGGSYTRREFRELCAKYDNRCLCCGKQFNELEADHVTPLSKGGSNGIENIQPLCQPCNRKKSDKMIDYRPKWDKKVAA